MHESAFATHFRINIINATVCIEILLILHVVLTTNMLIIMLILIIQNIYIRISVALSIHNNNILIIKKYRV